jgi:hypothetical protein
MFIAGFPTFVVESHVLADKNTGILPVVVFGSHLLDTDIEMPGRILIDGITKVERNESRHFLPTN